MTPCFAPRRILVIHPGALGDLVQALPAIGAIRARYPSAQLALLTGSDLAPVAASLDLLDDVLPMDTRRAYTGAPADRAVALASAAGMARRWRPDAAATFKAAPVWAMIAGASGARRRIGLTRGALGRALLAVPVEPPADRHHEDRYADVARALDADPATARRPRWPDALPAEASAFIVGAPVLAVAPGGARNVKQDMAVKRWAPDRWAAVVGRLAAEHPDLRVAILGAPGDRAEADVVRTAVPAGRVLDLTGRTTVAEARAVVAAAAACLVHDSGLLHVAATTETPVVAVFGPTDPGILCPRRPGVTAVWSPALRRACQDGRTGAVRACVTPCCMERVSVDTVLATVRDALARGSVHPSPRAGSAASLVGP